MRIIHLTPGAGRFYCGSCIRDNALVTALRAMDHDALLAPMYLPHVVDEPSAADGRMHFGGLNVYLQQSVKLFRRTPGWLDRLFDAPAVLSGLARLSGRTRASSLGPMTLSMLQGVDGRQSKEVAKLITWLWTQPRADVIVLSNALLAGLAPALQEAGFPTVVTLQGEDAFLDALPDKWREQAWELLAERIRQAHGCMAVSAYHAELMARRLKISSGSIAVVHNGISIDDFSSSSSASAGESAGDIAMQKELTAAPVIGYLARMCPPKGLATLVDAFIELCGSNDLDDRDATLCIAGSCVGPDVGFVRRQRRKLRRAGLSSRVQWRPNVDRQGKLEVLRMMSLLSVPATYSESFGLYILEAWAAGVPVVQPRHGAFPELIESSGGGVLCEPDDPRALAKALASTLGDDEGRREMGLRGRAAVEQRFTVRHMAERVAAYLQTVVDAAARRRAEGVDATGRPVGSESLGALLAAGGLSVKHDPPASSSAGP